MIAESSPITPEQLLRMPDGDAYELVGGKLKERGVGYKSGRVSATLLFLLSQYVYQHELGRVANADASFQCYLDEPGKVRRPDISYLCFATLPPDQEPTGHCRVPPDLAVEVNSPNDIFEEVAQKAAEYLAAGTKLVWVVDPATQMVYVYWPGGGRILTNRDELNGEAILPGFACHVSDLFVIGPARSSSSK
ncbi:Uma2 family endonuclease [Anatilimnocola sp. NA78]|uniref:Uma2 family endonuclease n=1 Tax=Anatilimnocola sp. NA78 TaxID=3415683 RepID=UPI003CE594AF